MNSTGRIERFWPSLLDRVIKAKSSSSHEELPRSVGKPASEDTFRSPLRTREPARPRPVTRHTRPEDDHFISRDELKHCIRRDIHQLFNRPALEASTDLSRHPRMRSSVLNYGIPAIIGQLADDYHGSQDRALLERALEKAIINFEPRLKADTVKVRVTSADKNGFVDPTLPVTFEIHGEVYATPYPEELFLQTTWNVAAGQTSITVA